MASGRPQRTRRPSRASLDAAASASYFSQSSRFPRDPTPPPSNQSGTPYLPLETFDLSASALPALPPFPNLPPLPSFPPTKKRKLHNVQTTTKRTLTPPPPPESTKKSKTSSSQPTPSTRKSLNTVKRGKKGSKIITNEEDLQKNALSLDNDTSMSPSLSLNGANKNEAKVKKPRKPRAKKEVTLRPSSRYLELELSIRQPVFPSPTLSPASPSPSFDLRSTALPQLHCPISWSPTITLLNGISVDVPCYQTGGPTNVSFQPPSNIQVQTQSFVSSILHHLSIADSQGDITILTFAINSSIDDLTSRLSQLSTPATSPSQINLSATLLLDRMVSDYPDSLFHLVLTPVIGPSTSTTFSHIYLLPLSPLTRHVIQAKMEPLYRRLFEYEDALTAMYLFIVVLPS